MESFFIILGILLILTPQISLVVDFVLYLFKGKRSFGIWTTGFLEAYIVLLCPAIVLLSGLGDLNDCCYDSAAFAFDHAPSLYFWVFIIICTFLYSRIRTQLLPPIPEIILNGLLILGIVINVLLILHGLSSGSKMLSWMGNPPIIAALLFALIENQQKLRSYIEGNDFESNNIFSNLGLQVLQYPALIKYPVILILTLPLVAIITAMLMLFGQKPDSMIRVFTETYKHGFSQLDFECDNVQCGGHYLCSVAANGNASRVKPLRYGLRGGAMIICNRQLLASNAFENVIETKLPRLHKTIRKYYDKIGDSVHHHYHFFNIKMVSDIVYVAMKPLEWIFIFVLYCTDVNPENRIALQYIDREGFNKFKQSIR